MRGQIWQHKRGWDGGRILFRLAIDARGMAIAVLVGVDRGRNIEQDKSIDAKKRISSL